MSTAAKEPEYLRVNPFRDPYMDFEPKLPPEVKEKWVAALRSGKYKRCKRTLKSGRSFCAMGVLHEIYGFDWSTLPRNKTLTTTDFSKSELKVPLLVSGMIADINDADSRLVCRAGKPVLPRHPSRFKVIADIIEKWL